MAEHRLGPGRLTRRACIAAAPACLLAPRHLGAASAGTGGSRLPGRLVGAFVNWGARGREDSMAAWEHWLDQAPSSVPAMDYYGDKTWADFTKLSGLPAAWKAANPRRALVWSVPLTHAGTSLSDIATGLHDADFRVAAGAIADAQPDAVIRLGWEMNVGVTAWSAKGKAADYIAAYRRAVALFRAASRRFSFDWCPSWSSQDSPAGDAYPGDDVVDIIGLDIYDYGGVQDPEERWRTRHLDGPFGLAWHKGFAVRHGKPMSYPEWGVGQAGDNPVFIQHMHDWLSRNAAHIRYAAYFDVQGQWPTEIDNGQFPAAQALFKRLFSRA